MNLLKTPETISFIRKTQHKSRLKQNLENSRYLEESQKPLGNPKTIEQCLPARNTIKPKSKTIFKRTCIFAFNETMNQLQSNGRK